jgi:competence protein ComEA
MDPFTDDPLPAGWRVVEPTAGDRPSKPENRAGTRRMDLTAAVAVLVAVLAGAVLLFGPGVVPAVVPGGTEASTSVDEGPDGTGQPGDPSIRPSPAAIDLVVDVSGAVRRPGLYRLPAGSRVGDAIAAAGGFGPRVDAAAVTASINLAARLEDGSKVLVPERGSAVASSTALGTGGDGGGDSGGATGSSAGPAGAAASSTPGETARVDLNRATQAELEALPGIGPVTARKILDSRASAPFQQPDDLLSRGLVRAGVYDEIRELVVVAP